MARRLHTGKSTKTRIGIFLRVLFGKLFFLTLIGLLVLVAIPIFAFGAGLGGNILPTVTRFFSKLSAPQAQTTPTPLPPFPSTLPQPGSLPYTVQEGDSCVSILAFEMHMNAASTIFSDAKPETVKALNDVLKQDCHTIQPGMTLPLPPQYPLVALGGVVLKIEASTAEQVLPTPLIHIQPTAVDDDQPPPPDCSGGCKLTVRLNAQTQIFLVVKTELPIRVGSWVWAQAMFPRKAIPGFDNYPYADPKAAYNGMTLQVCDFQVDDKHDDDSLPCQRLDPNTIVTDQGAWLFGVTGPGALDHWGYPLKAPAGTRVLLWLTLEHGKLVFKSGNPAYHYNETSQFYEKL